MATLPTPASGGTDLPPELQNELRTFEAVGRDISLYDLLGVTPDADGGTVRRAYLDRSRRYHPDAWFRKNVGEFGPLLSRAFQKLSAAYQVLSDEDARAAYDRVLKQRLSVREREAMERRRSAARSRRGASARAASGCCAPRASPGSARRTSSTRRRSSWR